MNSKMKSNPSVQCSVTSCCHHNSIRNACSLSSIRVGSCGPTSKDCACTECASYELSPQHPDC